MFQHPITTATHIQVPTTAQVTTADSTYSLPAPLPDFWRLLKQQTWQPQLKFNGTPIEDPSIIVTEAEALKSVPD